MGSPAPAVIVDIQATGNWEYYSGPDFDYHLVPYTVRFTYDTAAAPTNLTATQGVYPGLSLSLTVHLAEGTWTHTTNAPSITVNNGTFSDSFLIGSPVNPAGAPAFLGAAVDFYGFDLTGPAATTFADTSLPAEITLADFHFRKAKVYTGGFANNYISKDSDTLGAAAIPEPSTWALLAGVAALGAATLRRRVAAQGWRGSAPVSAAK
jgi:hypothetical protein